MSHPEGLFADDAGFVRAPAQLVYRRLAHIGAWPSWWQGTRVRPLAPTGSHETWALELRGQLGRRVRLRAVASAWREETGFVLSLTGDLDGSWELWLEPSAGGTVVHHVVVATSLVPRPDRVLSDLRRAIRRGLWDLKDLVQIEARTSAGLEP